MCPHGIHCFLYYFINCIKCIQFCTYIVLRLYLCTFIHWLLLCVRRVNCPIADPRLGYINTFPSIVVLCLKKEGSFLEEASRMLQNALPLPCLVTSSRHQRCVPFCHPQMLWSAQERVARVAFQLCGWNRASHKCPNKTHRCLPNWRACF